MSSSEIPATVIPLCGMYVSKPSAMSALKASRTGEGLASNVLAISCWRNRLPGERRPERMASRRASKIMSCFVRCATRRSVRKLWAEPVSVDIRRPFQVPRLLTHLWEHAEPLPLPKEVLKIIYNLQIQGFAQLCQEKSSESSNSTELLL